MTNIKETLSSNEMRLPINNSSLRTQKVQRKQNETVVINRRKRNPGKK